MIFEFRKSLMTLDTHDTYDTCDTLRNFFCLFLKKIAKTFVNRNGNVVPLQRQKEELAQGAKLNVECLNLKRLRAS